MLFDYIFVPLIIYLWGATPCFYWLWETLNSALRQVYSPFHKVWASASSFNFKYPLVSLRSSGSCLSLVPRLPATSILPSTFPCKMCFRRQFQRKVWPIRLTFLLIVYRIFLSSSTLCSTSFLARSVQLIVSILLQHHISKLTMYFRSTFRSIEVSASGKFWNVVLEKDGEE